MMLCCRTMGRRLLIVLIVALGALGVLAACTQQGSRVDNGKLHVITTLFPVYDFVRTVGGDHVETVLLLPPGVEPHSFDPRPEDLRRVAGADLFLYTNPAMEPWAEKLASGLVRSGKPLLVEAGRGARYLAPTGGGEGEGGHRHEGAHGGAMDPHIWLDIDNAMLMVDNIAAALAQAAPARRDFFLANAAAYKKQLAALDGRFRERLSGCASRDFIHGGHYAFAYLAARYQLRYISAFGVSAESEPSPRKLIELVKRIREKRLAYVFYEELLSPRVAQTLATETGVQLLKLHGIHNLTKSELAAGASYLSLMEQNLASLGTGLGCR